MSSKSEDCSKNCKKNNVFDRLVGIRALSERPELIAFVLLSVGMFLVLCLFGDEELYFDDAIYWTLGRAYDWDCTNLAWGFRGYLLPFIFSLAYKLGKLFRNEFVGLWILSALTFAFLHTYIFKRIYGILHICEEEDRLRIALYGMISGAVSAVLFRGLYKYALSDIYAFTAMLLCVIIFRDLMLYKDMKKIPRLFAAFAFGYLLYGMYNIRTIYLFLSMGLILAFIVVHFFKRYRTYWYDIILMVTGLATGMAPMIRMNVVQLGSFSWKVPTDGLMLFQIYAGIYTDRYATYVGDKDRFSQAGMYFYDELGQKILEYEGITSLDSYADYLKLVLKYPFDFIGIYMRHLLNMLYPIFPNQYIKSIDQNKVFFLLLAFTLLFICTIYLIRFYKIDMEAAIALILILFPCICILPGAVEIRFFFGAYYIMTMFAVSGAYKVWQYIKKKGAVSYIMAYIILLFIYVAYCGSMLASTEEGTAIISRL